MSFVMTVRGAPPAIKRVTYRCTDCGAEWKHVHLSGDEVVPDCPVCAQAAAAPMPAAPAVRASPEIRGRHAAVDLAQDMAENDYGMTDMNDYQKPGDVAFKGPPPMQTAAADQLKQEMAEAFGTTQLPMDAGIQARVKDFWKADPLHADSPSAPTPAAAQTQLAQQAQAQATANKQDVISMVDTARKTGSMAPRYNVVAREEMPQK